MVITPDFSLHDALASVLGLAGGAMLRGVSPWVTLVLVLLGLGLTLAHEHLADASPSPKPRPARTLFVVAASCAFAYVLSLVGHLIAA